MLDIAWYCIGLSKCAPCTVRDRDFLTMPHSDLVANRHESVYGIVVLHIDELEQMVAKFVKEDDIEKVIVTNVVIMLLLYANDGVFLEVL